MISYTDIALKLTVGLLSMLLQINLSGKGNLAPSSAIDQLQNYALGGMIGGMIYNTDISILQFLLILTIWTLIVLCLKFLANHNRQMKKVIDGQPILLIRNGQIQVENALKNGLTAHDLSFKLRTNGVLDIRTVKRAILEQNGALTITQVGDDSIKFPLVMDGQIDDDALESLDKSTNWLLAELTSQGYELNEVYMANYLAGELVIFPYIQKNVSATAHSAVPKR